jgi:methyl-galactoside transport system permease protein
MTVKGNKMLARFDTLKSTDVSTFLLNYALYFILGAILVIVIVIDPKFASVTNIINIIKQASTKGILALGVAGLIVLAGTDLSIGRVMGFSAAIVASLVQAVTYSARYYPGMTAQISLFIPLGLAIAVAVAFSLINGFGTAFLRMHPFIVTLGTQLIAYGCTCIYIEHQPSGTAQALSTFEKNFLEKAAGTFSVGGINIPFVVIYFLICAVIVHIIWTRTKLGKNMFAVGGNEEAARVSGVSVAKTIMLVYLMAGVLYGISAFLETARVQSVGANTGINYELDAISACVIGGVSFFGGVGTIPGVVIGSILLQSINYSLYFLGVNAYLQYIIRGLIIIIAVAIDVRKYIDKK